MIQALPVPRTLDAVKAEEVSKVVRKLGKSASFRSVWKEVARAGILRHNKTLRTYLDLLVRSGVLSVRMRDVRSVYSQQIYLPKSRRPKVWVGLGILQKHGLNWDVPEADIRAVATDFSGLVRSRSFDQGLMASLEDCLADEFYRDANKKTGTVSFVVAMISTRRLDLPYLLRRADGMRSGRAFRLLFNRILEVTSSNKTDLDACVFFAVRDRFLRITRQYAQSGFWKLVDKEKGIGTIGLGIVERLGESDLILAAAKQLGVTG
jgi:hypothetical protein